MKPKIQIVFRIRNLPYNEGKVQVLKEKTINLK
jgi:hypothetical protein